MATSEVLIPEEIPTSAILAPTTDTSLSKHRIVTPAPSTPSFSYSLDVISVIGVLVLGCGRVWCGEILHYSESQHSRSEEGLPGYNVTGTWSWVDSYGESHHIWYVADTGGFRAFGDSVPSQPGAAAELIPIGVPVVTGVPLFTGQRTLAKGVPAFPAEKRTLEEGVPGRGAGQRVPVKGTGSHPQQGTAPAESLSSGTQPRDIFLQSLTEEFKNSIGNGGNCSLTPGSDELRESESDVSITADHVTTPSVAARGVALPVFASQHTSSEFVAGQSEHEEDDLLLQQPEEPASHTAKPLATSSENNVMAPVFDKLTSGFGDPDDNPQESRDIKNALLEIMSLPPDQPITGTDFVLVNRIRIPNVPKPRVGSQQLVPQPVSVKGRIPPVIMGLHTSGRSTHRRLPLAARSLAPLGIHLLNLVPFQDSRKNKHANGPVPRPVRVVGEPSLDNFYRPAQLVFTTPSPFRLPSPIRDYDYQYFDYDYADYESGYKSGRESSFRKTRSKSLGEGSEENSKESGFPDSEEKED
nr:uncharacterized protein LOC128687772 [Cherax quadricarinatus]